MSIPQTSRKRSIDEVGSDAPPLAKRSKTLSTTTVPAQQLSEIDDPVVICSAPKYQWIWNRLPFGILFELARLAFTYDVDLEGIPHKKLQELEGSHISGIKKLHAVLKLSQSIPIMDTTVAAALDWESECIVKDNGEMLEYRGDSQPRSGRVFFQFGLDIKTLLATHKRFRSGQGSAHSIDCKEIILPAVPRMEGSCLFTRVFGSHRFLRLKLLERLSCCSDPEDLLVLYRHTLRPIHILGRTFRPLVEKDGTIFYYLEGLDYVGTQIEKFCDNETGSYGLGRHIKNTTDLLDWWLPLAKNRGTLMCKLVTRLHLGLSETHPGLFMEPDGIMLEEDIVRDGVVFTDGCGMVSEESGIELFHKCASTYPSAPSAYQIRISTAKGVVQVAPKRNVEVDNGRWIAVTKSMLKAMHGNRRFTNGPVHGMHILDAAHYVTCVVKAARYSHPARLSSQLIPILCNQGVPEEALQKLQEATLNQIVASLANPLLQMRIHPPDSSEHRRHRLALAKAIYDHAHLISKIREEKANFSGSKKSRKQVWHGRDDWIRMEAVSAAAARNGEIGGFSKDPIISSYEGLFLAVCSGLDILTSRYFTSLWRRLTEQVMLRSIEDFHIPVRSSAYCTILPDFTGELPEGYISFTPPEPIKDAAGKFVDFTQGTVLVGRHPALLPTDIQKVQLANIPSLRDRPGVIFFSTKGTRPLADILAGGDYDGDEVILIWEECLVQPFHNADISLADQSEAVKSAFNVDSLDALLVSHSLDRLHDDAKCRELEKQLLASVKVPILVGKYYTYYLKAVEAYGIDSEEARAMAHKFNILLDAPKTAKVLTSEARRVDHEMFHNYEDPHHQQIFSKKKSMDNKWKLPLTKGYGALSNLAESGLALLKKITDDLKKTIHERNSLDLFDELAGPWRYACKLAREDPGMTDELKLVEAAVIKAQGDFYKICCEKRQDSAERQVLTRGLMDRFHSNPPIDQLPSLAGIGYEGDFLYLLRASYAYYIDHRDWYTGDNRGFAWQIALRTLLGRVAKKEPSVTIPWEIFRRFKPHSTFCADPDIFTPSPPI